jgi:hypothetical protein
MRQKLARLPARFLLKLEHIEMRHYSLAVTPGGGVGPEVITEGVIALQAVAELDGGLEFDI